MVLCIKRGDAEYSTTNAYIDQTKDDLLLVDNTDPELGIFNSAHSYEIYHTVNSGTVNLKSLILSIPTTKVI